MTRDETISLLKEYNRKLEKEKIGPAGSIIAIRTDGGAALSRDGGDACFTDMNGLKVEEPAAYEIFANLGEVNALIFASPVFCALAAKRGSAIPAVLDDMAQIVGTRAAALDAQDSAAILRTFTKSNACLLKTSGKYSPGALTAGLTPEHAFAAMLIMEKTAQALIEGEYIGGVKQLNRGVARLMRRLYRISYSKADSISISQTARDIQREIPEDELEARGEMIAFGTRLVEENLVQATWGNISFRLDERYMLVTPTGMAYARLTLYDIVRVDMLSLEYEGRLKPTSEKQLHAALLRAYPGVNCVIHSHPVNCSVFAAARKSLPVTDAQDAEMLGGDVAVSSAAIPGSKRLAKSVVKAARGGSCIMGAHGMLVCGASLSEAFEKCRVMEGAARKYLDHFS